MQKNKYLIIVFICLTNIFFLDAQIDSNLELNKFEFTTMKGFKDEVRNNSIRIAFYNVENLYDTENDSLTNDDAFTPEGSNHWTKGRYWKKINNLGKVILSIGGWEPPEIIGLCEIENEKVLKDLIYNSPLKKFKYRIVHYNSPDNRGIDVALLYRQDKFKVLKSKPIKVSFSEDTTAKTRDILYVCGAIPSTNDTLNILVNHWPSRYGGYAATIKKRNRAAQIARQVFDSIININSDANFILIGDLNDYPTDISLIEHLKAKPDTLNTQNYDLINLSFKTHTKGKIGSHKYQEHWGVLDQIIVSNQLTKREKGLKVSKEWYNIFRADFLITTDETFLGIKPNRTFIGTRYNGGYADHLPVFVDLEW